MLIRAAALEIFPAFMNGNDDGNALAALAARMTLPT